MEEKPFEGQGDLGTNLPNKYALGVSGTCPGLFWFPGSMCPELCLLQSLAVSPAS